MLAAVVHGLSLPTNQVRRGETGPPEERLSLAPGQILAVWPCFCAERGDRDASSYSSQPVVFLCTVLHKVPRADHPIGAQWVGRRSAVDVRAHIVALRGSV